MQELNTNNEVDWVEHLVGEMVEGVPEYPHSAEAMNIMKESLALTCLSEEFVKEQLAVGQASITLAVPPETQLICMFSSCSFCHAMHT